MQYSLEKRSCGNQTRKLSYDRLRRQGRPMVKIKICGITNTQDALWAANLGADYVGLNFYPPSPRKVSSKNAKDIVSKLPPFVTAVGVFVDADVAEMLKLIKSTPLKAVQLHGTESP